MRLTKLGKPVCISRRDGRKCRRVGVWFFRWFSDKQPVCSYFCEACASDKGYCAFGQSLQRVEF